MLLYFWFLLEVVDLILSKSNSGSYLRLQTMATEKKLEEIVKKIKGLLVQ